MIRGRWGNLWSDRRAHGIVTGPGHRHGARARPARHLSGVGRGAVVRRLQPLRARTAADDLGRDPPRTRACCSTVRACWPAPPATTSAPASTAGSAACSASGRSSRRASCAAAARRSAMIAHLVDAADTEGHEFVLLFSDIGPKLLRAARLRADAARTGDPDRPSKGGAPAMLVRAGDDRDLPHLG